MQTLDCVEGGWVVTDGCGGVGDRGVISAVQTFNMSRLVDHAVKLHVIPAPPSIQVLL